MKVVAVALGLALVAASSIADAGDDDAWFVSMGGTFGLAVRNDASRVLGGEISMGWFKLREGARTGADVLGIPHTGRPVWLGAYVEAVADGGAGSARVSFGPEIGQGCFGLDAGVLEQIEGSRSGATVRATVTIGVLALYARYNRYFDDMPFAGVPEVGVLLKLPIPLTGDGLGVLKERR